MLNSLVLDQPEKLPILNHRVGSSSLPEVTSTSFGFHFSDRSGKKKIINTEINGRKMPMINQSLNDLPILLANSPDIKGRLNKSNKPIVLKRRIPILVFIFLFPCILYHLSASRHVILNCHLTFDCN